MIRSHWYCSLGQAQFQPLHSVAGQQGWSLPSPAAGLDGLKIRSTCIAPMGNLAVSLSVSHQRIKALQKKKTQKPQLNPLPLEGRQPPFCSPFLFYLQAGLFAFVHCWAPLSQPRTQLGRLRNHLGQTWPTASLACSMAPASCPHPGADFDPPAWGRMVARCSHHPVLLPLAGCPLGTRLSTVPKHRLNAAGARAFGDCTPRPWHSLTEHHPAKRRLQHFSLLKHVRQRSRRLCPLDPTALCQPRRGKAVLWRRLLPFQLPANTRIGILRPSLHPLSVLSWVMFLLRIHCNSGVTGNYFACLVWPAFKQSKTLLLNLIDLFIFTQVKKGE